MQYVFQTNYDQKALAAMAKGVRKTARKQRSRRSHIFGWIVVVLAVLLSLSSGEEGFVVDGRKIITWVAAAAILIVLIFEDRINGYVARKRMLKGTQTVTAVFDTEKPDMYVSETAVGKSEFFYDRIFAIAETKEYFIFVFSYSHAQVYCKSCLTEEQIDAFRKFISEKTEKTIAAI